MARHCEPAHLCVNNCVCLSVFLSWGLHFYLRGYFHLQESLIWHRWYFIPLSDCVHWLFWQRHQKEQEGRRGCCGDQGPACSSEEDIGMRLFFYYESLDSPLLIHKKEIGQHILICLRFTSKSEIRGFFGINIKCWWMNCANKRSQPRNLTFSWAAWQTPGDFLRCTPLCNVHCYLTSSHGLPHPLTWQKHQPICNFAILNSVCVE